VEPRPPSGFTTFEVLWKTLPDTSVVLSIYTKSDILVTLKSMIGRGTAVNVLEIHDDGTWQMTTEFGDIWYDCNLNFPLLYTVNGICLMRMSHVLLTCSVIWLSLGPDERDGLHIIISFVTVNSHQLLFVYMHVCGLEYGFLYNAVDIACVLTSATACFCPSNRPSVTCGLHCSSTATHPRCCSGLL